MTYNCSTLSPADFEDLSRDLIGKKLGIRFEGFATGPDGGIDGRHAKGERKIILQAKHYAKSSFSTLKSAMKRERSSIDQIKPHRYILVTSRSLTPPNKKALADIIGPALKDESDIIGLAELNDLLRDHPEVQKAHIKLWLSSSAVLERVIRSAAYAYTAMSRADIEAKVRVYAQNPSFKESRDKLEANHVLIVSGPPGVGKTTLAEMLAYAYIGEEWEFVAIRSLEDGFASIVDAKKQIFFFDDFLGKVALDARALASKDSELARFIRCVRKTANPRFILTTRAYIFEEARRTSEYLADKQFEVTKYVLDVGMYTRRIRSRILYNHLHVSDTPKPLVNALVNSGALPKIIDHKNYNPRIVEWMTDALNLRDLPADQYVSAFIAALDDPSRVWDTAFRTHISAKCRNLLITLFFCSEYSVVLVDLREQFDVLHSTMCKKYGHPFDAKDFSESLKVLEGSFIAITGRNVSFINPSVRDYLTEYLKDAQLLETYPSVALSAQWAKAVWDQYLRVESTSADNRSKFAERFIPFIETLPNISIWKGSVSDPSRVRFFDMTLSRRLELLVEWWDATENAAFIDAALLVLQKSSDGFYAGLDDNNLVELIADIGNRGADDLPHAEELRAALEERLEQLLDGGMRPDALESLCFRIDLYRHELSPSVIEAAHRAVAHEIETMAETVAGIDSEMTLDEHMQVLPKLAERANISQELVAVAIDAVKQRITVVKERTAEAEEPSFSGRTEPERDTFGDSEIKNLFALLT